MCLVTLSIYKGHNNQLEKVKIPIINKKIIKSFKCSPYFQVDF